MRIIHVNVSTFRPVYLRRHFHLTYEDASITLFPAGPDRVTGSGATGALKQGEQAMRLRAFIAGLSGLSYGRTVFTANMWGATTGDYNPGTGSTAGTFQLTYETAGGTFCPAEIEGSFTARRIAMD